jgi:fucose 4-O-acetylase-like acetyltransferase
MIRESTAIWTRTIYRPLRRAGLRVSRQLARNAPRPSRRPERCVALDNARFMLIALVVVGHLLEQLVDAGPLATALYRWIYLFHMPAFVLISGALSRRTLNRRRALGLATGLLIPYLVFQTLYPAWDAWLFQTGDGSQGYLTPYWLLWYLPSLACWRLLLPLFAHRWALPIAVAIALAAGTAPWIGYPFSLSRTLVFFPLFLFGHRIGAQKLQRFGVWRLFRRCAVMALAAAAAGAWYLRDLDPEWLYHAAGDATLHVDALPGCAIRLALLVASSVCALAVIALIPRRPYWAEFGRRSLTTYLTHGFLVRGLLAAGVFGWLAQTVAPVLQIVLCLAAGGLIATLLSTRIADKLAAPLTRPVRCLAAIRRRLATGRPQWPAARSSMSGRDSRHPWRSPSGPPGGVRARSGRASSLSGDPSAANHHRDA